MSLREASVMTDGSLAELKSALAERTGELEEAREREAATAEVLES